MARKKVLDDHKKEGKKFIPPMIYKMDGKLQETDFTKDILPDILWMGLICEEIGYKEGIKLIKELCDSANELNDDGNYINFSIAHNYNKLSPEKRKKLSLNLVDKEIYEILKYLLSPLNIFYFDSPFTFLGKEIDLEDDSKKEFLDKLKRCIDNHFDRFKISSVRALANVLYIRQIHGKISYNQELKAPDIELLFSDPDSEEGKKTIAQVRAGTKMEFMIDYDNAWSKSFWNQSYKLDKCE